MSITTDKASAIAASAYNVCGPGSGTPARPSTVASFDQVVILGCLLKYQQRADVDFSADEVAATVAMFKGLTVTLGIGQAFLGSITQVVVGVSSLADAQRHVRGYIEANDLGASEWFGGKLHLEGEHVGDISYNGRAWTPGFGEELQGEPKSPRKPGYTITKRRPRGSIPAFPRCPETLRRVFARARLDFPNVTGMTHISPNEAIFQVSGDPTMYCVPVSTPESAALGWIKV